MKTYDYLYQLNLGPLDPCVLCGLVTKTTDLFRQCSKGQKNADFCGGDANFEDHYL